MDSMDIDSPIEAEPLEPRDRVFQRLLKLGVPFEYLRMMFSGLVAFVKDNPSWLVEIVSTILPTDQEVTEALQESKSGGKKAIAPTMKARFRECMLWLQWLMFLGEPSTALKNLSKMSAGRGVCGAVWGKNDIAYRCRTCEHDPTCAICVPCFQNGNHKDHDYSVIYTGGGCCDCGDVTAWKREGFCSKHKGAEQIQPLPEEYANSVGPVLDALFTIWKNKLVTVETTVHDPPKASYRVSAAKKAANELSFVVVETLLEFCKHSESLLSFVSKRIIALDGLLELLVKAESLLSELVVRKLHELLLKLLGEPMFKYEFAKVFLGYYPFVVRETIKEGSDGALKKYPLLPTFSVQILTVPTLTPRLVKEMNLLAMLLASLRDILDHCAGDNGRLQLTKWANLNEITIRIVEDIRFVMSHNIVPKYVTHKQRGTLRTWMELLCYLQGMSPLKRETGIHIEEENESVNLPFVLCHSVANIHTLLVDGAFSNGEESDNDFLSSVHMEDTDDDGNIRHAKVGRLSQENTVCSSTDMGCASATMTALVKSDVYQLPSSVTYLTCECLKAIETCLECGNASGAQSGCTSSVTGNFLGLKKTLSRIRRGSNIFSARSSNEDKTKQSYLFTHRGSHMGSEMENATGAGHESKTVAENETCSSSFCDSSNEGDNTTESPVFLRLLSSSNWPDIIYDVSTQDISVHIPLHRLLSLLLLKALKTCHGESESRSMNSSRVLTSPSTTYGGFFERLLGGCHPHGFSAFIMEHPLRNRVFSAQVHAGMWRKNGDAAILNFEWYRSVRWSEQGLELDLFLLQCCAALAPADLYITRIIERFGLSDYLSLTTERSSEYEPVLIQEMLTLIIQIVQERRFSGLTPAENLKRELIHKLAVGDATRSQLVKSLPRDLSKCDQLQEILDSIAVYSNPSGLNQGMYSLRWSYWKELDLYHPRWNSRDLQVAEERYMRYCNVSALTTQLPKWTSIYPPLVGASRIATCPVVLQLVRAVVMYAVFSDELVNTRAPDDVLLASLHLLSLALDISCQQGEYDPLLPFLSEDISGELKYDGGELSLLSLLVSLMRMHKRLDSVDFLESGSCNLSALIESFLKKFAEVDRVCMTKLQQLAPEVVIHLSKSMTGEDTSMSAVSSDREKRKAKARERQAAIMAKMKADQSKFLSSIDSTAEDESNSEPGQTGSDDVQDMEETEDYICSLCHDPKSKTPICFLVLLQKSRLLSFTNRGPLSWNAGQLSDKERVSISTDKITNQSLVNDSVGLGAHSSTQLAQLIQNLINEFSSYSQPGEVTAIIEFVMAQFPLIGNIQVPHGLMDGHGYAAYTTERLEQDLYNSICKSIHCKTTICTSKEEMQKFFTTGDIVKRNVVAESVLVGKYLAALSKERKDHPSSSENAHDNGAQAGHTQHVSVNNGFGPEDCNGIHLSSCGHAVHQACLDRYLSSLRERQSRRIVFEGGHIVDPDQGEFLCPVCRRLANSVLPSLAGDRQNVWKQPIIVAGPSKAAGPLSSAETNSLLLQQASSLLLSAANTVGTEDILRNLPPKSNGGTKLNLDSVSRVLLKMYFPSRLVKLSESGRINLPMIMWDTLKYSLTSIEIAARCGRSRATPNYDLNNLYKELKSSSGFILSLLLKIVQSMKSKNFLGVLQRYRGIQLLAESICSGGYGDHASSGFGGKGNLSCILKHISKEEPYPDTDFWNQVADPILAHNAFSSLMWVLFCLPQPFSSCEESFLSLVHIFYVVSLVQSVLACLGKYYYQTSELFCHDNVITDISKVLGEYGWMQQYFVLNYYNSSSDLKEMIRRLTFPYLRRCALLWRLLSTSVPASFSDGDHTSTASFQSMEDIMGKMDDAAVELRKIQELENIFKIPSLDVALSDQSLRSSVGKWLHHFCKEYGSRRSCSIVYVNPAVPFKLMDLPHVYHDLLQRFLKQRCAQCKNVIEDPALCLLCGKLCSPSFKSCCGETGCLAHAATCGAGTGVYLLIKRTTILLQRSARQAPWPSPYLDAFGEEDTDMRRGKPLYLNEERYAALAYMVASHGLDRSPKVLGQTVIGTLFLV